MSQRNEINNNNHGNSIKIPTFNDEKTYKIIKIQSFIRGILAQNKCTSLFNNSKSQISQELEQKKLINETNITECESHLIYSKLVADKKIIPFSVLLIKNQELNNLCLKLSKYSFTIPYYIITSPNEVYKGSWNLNKRYHGHGVKYIFDENMTNNKRIEGIFINGFLFGRGLVIFSNGEMISGNFDKNNLDGSGEHYRKDNTIYRGNFKNGKYNGIGKEIFEDGSVFDGFFSEGQKKYGKYEFKNGSKYHGEFLNNVFHGKGVYKWGNKREYDGNWKDGKMNGKGKFLYPDGSFYEGEFLDGKKNGYGKYIWGKDRYYEGYWKNDKQNGSGIYYDKNKITKGIWVDGKIMDKNNDIIKQVNHFLKQTKSRNRTPIKKGVTQEYFYRKNNLTEVKKKKNKLNFNPTAKGKYSQTFYRNIRNYINYNSNKNKNSIYSIENSNINKSYNNNGDEKTTNNEEKI